MKHITLQIYKAKQPINTDNLEKLSIDNKPIKFLKEILLAYSAFWVDNDGNWILKFFMGKSYEQNLLITHNQKMPFEQFEYLSSLAMLIDDREFDEDIAATLSVAIRGSKAIKCKDFVQYPSHFGHIDGRGLSFFSKIDNQLYNFKRQSILYALAYAYLGAIELIGNKLAQKVDDNKHNIDELNQLYIEATKFNSVLFFHQPVLIKNASLSEAWRQIDAVLQVNIAKNELLERLSTVHYILNLDDENKKKIQEKQQQNKQEKYNLAFAVMGLIISALGLIELFK